MAGSTRDIGIAGVGGGILWGAVSACLMTGQAVGRRADCGAVRYHRSGSSAQVMTQGAGRVRIAGVGGRNGYRAIRAGLVTAKTGSEATGVTVRDGWRRDGRGGVTGRA